LASPEPSWAPHRIDNSNNNDDDNNINNIRFDIDAEDDDDGWDDDAHEGCAESGRTFVDYSIAKHVDSDVGSPPP
jgi:hypothetical protein